jgi:hypothetical protein
MCLISVIKSRKNELDGIRSTHEGDENCVGTLGVDEDNIKKDLKYYMRVLGGLIKLKIRSTGGIMRIR